MMLSIALMQGRLNPPLPGSYQAFPGAVWKEEFKRAKALGIHAIEWIFDTHENPLSTEAGRLEMKQEMQKTGISLPFVLADYFMERPILDYPQESLELLLDLVHALKDISAKGLELPFVDASSIQSLAEEKAMREFLLPVVNAAIKEGVFLLFETDFAPQRLRKFLEGFRLPYVKATLDCGNSAGLGFDLEEEFQAYGHWISNIHVKDRTLGGGTLPLGEGAVDFPKLFDLIQRYDYKSTLVLQGARQDSGKELETVESYRHFVLEGLEASQGLLVEKK